MTKEKLQMLERNLNATGDWDFHTSSKAHKTKKCIDCFVKHFTKEQSSDDKSEKDNER